MFLVFWEERVSPQNLNTFENDKSESILKSLNYGINYLKTKVQILQNETLAYLL